MLLTCIFSRCEYYSNNCSHSYCQLYSLLLYLEDFHAICTILWTHLYMRLDNQNSAAGVLQTIDIVIHIYIEIWSKPLFDFINLCT